MINKINISQVSRVTGQTVNDKKQPNTQATNTGDEAEFQLSGEASKLQSILNTPPEEISTAKLEEIRQAIISGEYQVDYDKLAKNLLGEPLDKQD